MKINGEARLLLVMGLAVLLGGGAMVLVNRSPALTPPPEPTPVPLAWTPSTFDPLVKQARHLRGAQKAPRFTLIEFGDLECPMCRRTYNFFLTKLDAYPGIRFGFIHFPLAMHQHAEPAAIATEAAGMQGKFWQMFDGLYAGEKTELTPELYDATAQKIGLDLKKFKADLADPRVAVKVTNDQKLAQDAHIFQTPTFLLRDEKTGKIYQVVGGKELDAKLSSLTGKPPVLPADYK